MTRTYLFVALIGTCLLAQPCKAKDGSARALFLLSLYNVVITDVIAMEGLVAIDTLTGIMNAAKVTFSNPQFKDVKGLPT